MSASRAPRRAPARGQVGLVGVGVAAVLFLAALWGLTLFRAPSASGSLGARVNAVGATVRCPICPEPIPLNAVHNAQAVQMRQFIRDRLQAGASEDQVRQELVARYGAGILLAPPQRGFDLLIWLVPLVAIAACAVAVLLVVRRWSGHGDLPDRFTAAAPSTAPTGSETRRYEELLDRELAARE